MREICCRANNGELKVWRDSGCLKICIAVLTTYQMVCWSQQNLLAISFLCQISREKVALQPACAIPRSNIKSVNINVTTIVWKSTFFRLFTIETNWCDCRMEWLKWTCSVIWKLTGCKECSGYECHTPLTQILIANCCYHYLNCIVCFYIFAILNYYYICNLYILI